MRSLTPELILFGVGLFLLVLDFFEIKESLQKTASAIIAGLGFFGAIAAVEWCLADGPVTLFSNSYKVDSISQIFKAVLIFAGAFSSILGVQSKEIKGDDKFSFVALMLLSTCGLCILTSANSVLLIYPCYALIGVTSVVLTSFSRNRAITSEAGLKQFWQEALSLGLFTVGIALLFSMTNTFDIDEMRKSFERSTSSKEVYWVVFGLLFFSILTRLAAFPFYFTTPDFLQGVSIPAAAHNSVAFSTGTIVILLKFLVQIFSTRVDLRWNGISGIDLSSLVLTVAVFTMTIGNLSALYQRNLKRIMGYFMMAQMGYLLLGLGLTSAISISASILGLVSFVLAFMGTFMVLQPIIDSDKKEDVENLTGLVWRSPFLGVMLGLFFLSLAALPPLFGSTARIYILSAVMEQKLYLVALLLVFNWVLGLAGYLPLIRKIFDLNSRSQNLEPISIGPLLKIIISGVGIPTIVLGFWWDPFMSYIRQSMESIAW